MRPQVVQAADVERERPASGARIEPTAAGMTAFGHDLIASTDDENVIVSPASIAYAFGMARAGAGGDTAAQIDQVLGFPSEGLHEALNAITYDTVTVDGPPPKSASGETRKQGDPPKPPVVTVANGLFAKADFEFQEDFLRTLAANYGSGVQTVDFASDDAADVINAWAAEQTAGRIKKVFDQIDPETAMVLANAVYFKGDWRTHFEEGGTKDADFTTASGAQTTVKMMRQMSRMDYAVGDGWQAVELPYAGEEIVMRVMIPTDDDRHPAELLGPQTMSAVEGSLQTGLVNFSMPRFDFGTNVQLASALQELGMSAPFDPDVADFRGISEDENLYIAQAVHQANITVDEWGTEAAAVTALGLGVTSAPVPDVTIRADRAFAFTIVHKPTGTPLFMGQVADPSA